jgi:hypothetical protein
MIFRLINVTGVFYICQLRNGDYYERDSSAPFSARYARSKSGRNDAIQLWEAANFPLSIHKYL